VSIYKLDLEAEQD